MEVLAMAQLLHLSLLLIGWESKIWYFWQGGNGIFARNKKEPSLSKDLYFVSEKFSPMQVIFNYVCGCTSIAIKWQSHTKHWK